MNQEKTLIFPLFYENEKSRVAKFKKKLIIYFSRFSLHFFLNFLIRMTREWGNLNYFISFSIQYLYLLYPGQDTIGLKLIKSAANKKFCVHTCNYLVALIKHCLYMDYFHKKNLTFLEIKKILDFYFISFRSRNWPSFIIVSIYGLVDYVANLFIENLIWIYIWPNHIMIKHLT